MKKIVFIEDNIDVRETTKEILELADYEVFSVENGILGVEMAKKQQPDLVICDIMMPDLDGYGVLRILSKNPETSNIPFVFLTAKADKNDIRKGMNLGADDYITKPFNEAELLEAIETRLIRSQNLKRDNIEDIEGLDQFMDGLKGIDELKDLAKDRKVKTYKKKEIIFREDDYANYLYFIVSGQVKCIKTDDYGKDFVTEIHRKGDFIGYMTLLEESEYHETGIAMVPTEVAVIPKRDFQLLIQKNRDVATNFIKMLTKNVKDREERMLQLAYASVRERVASALIKLNLKENSEGTLIKMSISREDLAGIVGTAKESLVRTLSELKKDGLVETNGPEISIIDLKALEKISTGF